MRLLVFLFYRGMISLRPLATVVALLRFSALVRRHILAPPTLSGDMAVVSLTFILSLVDRPPFLPFFLGVPCRLRSLAVQRCENGS